MSRQLNLSNIRGSWGLFVAVGVFFLLFHKWHKLLYFAALCFNVSLSQGVDPSDSLPRGR